MNTGTSTSSAAGTSATAGVRPVIRAARCGRESQQRLQTAFETARAWAIAALAAVRSTSRSPSSSRAWNHGPLGRSFGRHRRQHARRVERVWSAVVARFEHGFKHGDRRKPVVIECFPEKHDRCNEGLLGNANIYGRLRLCPQLLHRDDATVAAVVLHEMMHQRIGVDDQRHSSCVPDRKQRCYRDNADRLVDEDRSDLAVRNIDNYVRFAMRVARTRGTR